MECLTYMPSGHECIWVLEGWQITIHSLFDRANDMLQSALVFGIGSSTPDGDAGGEDRLDDSVKVCHQCLWWVE